MSQYRAYFVSNGMDPTGEYTLSGAIDIFCKRNGERRGLSGFELTKFIVRCREDRTGPQEPDKRLKLSAWFSVESEGGLGWLANLPNCPCTICCKGKKDGCEESDFVNPDEDVWKGPQGITGGDEFHPGAVSEIRSKNSYPPEGSGQQCTYDKNGQLITHGAGAGTPDRRHSLTPTNPLGHFKHDVAPYLLAKEFDLIDFYLVNRPPNNGNDCKKNP